MKQVHYTYLDDMEKYNSNFNRRDYENKDEQEVIQEFKQYYAKHLPVDLLAWCRVNEPSDKMIYKSGYWDQITFIRQTIMEILSDSYEEYKNNPAMVISTHWSKSIKLPVCQINLPKYGVKMILRNNFYDWKVSVDSINEIKCDFKGLFDEVQEINSIYCEGFKEDQVYMSYKNNKKQFTIEIGDNHKLYTFMWLIKDYLKRL